MYLREIDPNETALVVVDMQNGFVSDDGGLARAGVSIVNQQAIVPAVRTLVELCRAKGLPILWSKQVHYANDATRARHRVPTHHQKRGITLCIDGTDDIEFPPALEAVLAPQDIVFEKHRSSCFFETTLEMKLKMLGVQVVIVCGVNSSYCIDSTVRDAYFRDFDVVVVKDCIAGSFDDLHDAFLKNFEIYFGDLFDLDEFTELIAKESTAGASSAR